MPKTEKPELSISRKFEILCLLLSGENPGILYDDMEFQEICLVKEFIVEKIIEFGIRKKGNSFSSNEISARLKVLNNYPQEKKCRQSVPKCNTRECFNTHHDCCVTRFKSETNVLCQLAAEYLFM
jgi:hypothetical protein